MPRKDLRDYQPSEELFFFDSNIWIFITGSIADVDKNKQNAYSGFFNKILRSNAKICISSLVLSEYFNVLLRKDFNLLKNSDPHKYKDFKKNYRNTERCKEVTKKVVRKIKKNLLATSVRIDDCFSEFAEPQLFSDIDTCDFNDNFFIQLCLKNNYIMVSDDRDMDHDDLTVLALIP
jgi:predicted nucleic acid-binding protein